MLIDWPKKGLLPSAFPSAKYYVLYRIVIVNMAASSHDSGVSPALANLLYQRGTRSSFVDYDVVGVIYGKLTFSRKMFEGKHECGIVRPSAVTFVSFAGETLDVASLFEIFPSGILRARIQEVLAL